jgi:NlpC/P60 family putative phage cell wall peptidase
LTRDEIITEARQWIGSEWQHQASLKGVACDCIGLIRGCHAELTGKPLAESVDYPRSAYYYCREEKLYPELKKYMEEIPLEEAQPGDVLTFATKTRFPDHHVGILSHNGFFVHACGDIGVQKVIESRLDDRWGKCLRHAFRFPGVEE